MKKRMLLSFLSIGLLLSGCKITLQKQIRPEGWYNISVSDDVEIFIDTASISKQGNVAYAREKRIFVSPQSREAYIAKIATQYQKMNKPEKVKQWNDFSYCIYNCEYECTNKRFRILSVEDYDSSGKLILKTTTPKNVTKWLTVGAETVGDYTFFFVCDYGN